MTTTTCSLSDPAWNVLPEKIKTHLEIGPIHDRLKTPCWNWTAGCYHNGYGQVRYEDAGVGRTVHRVVYKLLGHVVPDGFELDHLCRNRRCANPQHLEPVTQLENIMRGVGPGAKNGRKQKCDKGHDLSGPNLYTYKWKNGRTWRACKTCRIQYKRDWRARKRIVQP